MDCQELFNEVKSWLEAEEYEFQVEDENSFHLPINTKNGLLRVRLKCEEEPLLLVVSCPIPVRVPKEKLAEAGLMLHTLNDALRYGTFHLYAKPQVMAYRLPMMIRPDSDLAEQFSRTVSTAAGTMNAHIRSLTLLACSTTAARKALAKLKPKPECSAAVSRHSRGRVELN